MADKKISELTKLSSSDLDHRNDVIPIVDISSNTTKKIAPSGMPISGFAGAGTAATKNVGISNTNVLQANDAVSDDDFLKVDGTSVEGRSVAEVKSDLSLGNVHSLNTGIGNNNVLVSRGNLADLDFIRVTGSHLSGRSFSEVRTDLGLGNGYALNTGIANTNILVANNAVADNDFLKVDGVNIEGRTASELKSDLSLDNNSLIKITGTDVVTEFGGYSGLGPGRGTMPTTAALSNFNSPLSTSKQIRIVTPNSTGVIAGSGGVVIGNDNTFFTNDADQTTVGTQNRAVGGHGRLFRKNNITTLQIGDFTTSSFGRGGEGYKANTETGSYIIGKRITISGYPEASFNRSDYIVLNQTGTKGTITMTGFGLADNTGVFQLTYPPNNTYSIFVHRDAPSVMIGHKNFAIGSCNTVIGQNNSVRFNNANVSPLSFRKDFYSDVNKVPGIIMMGSDNTCAAANSTSSYYHHHNKRNATVIGHSNYVYAGHYGAESAGQTVIGSNNRSSSNASKQFETIIGSKNRMGPLNSPAGYPGGVVVGHLNRKSQYSYYPLIFGFNNYAGNRDIMIGYDNKQVGAAGGSRSNIFGKGNTTNGGYAGKSTIIGRDNFNSAYSSFIFGRNIKLGRASTPTGSTTATDNIVEIGWWQSNTSPNVRMRGNAKDKSVSFTLRNSATPPRTGGAHPGSEPSGTLGKEMFVIQRNADEVSLFCNQAGTGIKKIVLGNLNQ